jgi:hypothetical protein
MRRFANPNCPVHTHRFTSIFNRFRSCNLQKITSFAGFCAPIVHRFCIGYVYALQADINGGGDPQVLLVPTPQCFRIVSSEEQSSNTRHIFHFRSSAIPSRTVAPQGEGRRFGCVAVCAAMPSWFRLQMKIDPNANDRVRSNWRL